MAKTRAQANRAIRQEAVREQLATYGLVTQVIEIANKLLELDDLDGTRISALKASADIKLKLVDKYLPNLQSIESRNETIVRQAKDLDDERLASIATGGSDGAIEPPESQKAIH